VLGVYELLGNPTT